MNTSKYSDKVSKFLTSDEGDPVQGIREITPYLFRVLEWWGRQQAPSSSRIAFLEKAIPDSHRRIKLFLQLRGQNHLQNQHDNRMVLPGTLGVVLNGDSHEEQWIPDADNRYLQIFIGLFPGRLSVNIAGMDPGLGLPGHSRIFAGASLPFTEGNLLDQYLCFLYRRKQLFSHQIDTLSDIVCGGVRLQSVSAHSRLIRHAVTTVVENPCNPSLSVQYLAEQLGCHPDYLSRRFSLETGKHLMHYVRELRMEIAADLLLGKRLPVAEVANLCGYRDHSYFSSIFRQQYGSSPSTYVHGDIENHGTH
ncbi:MAG: helix-turn-helix transcriptional regulator [Kiritimatiellae bacterium]|jgi:AraC-like DNA-binding protein|nr:helix-turn-helix transcriptional regulator [Kiritimatiellia bacterium]